MYKDSPYSHTKLIIALTYLVILIYLSTSFWYDFGVLMVSLAHIISSLPGSSSGSEGICTSFFSELLLLLTLLPFVIFSFTFFRFDCFFGLPSLPFSDCKNVVNRLPSRKIKQISNSVRTRFYTLRWIPQPHWWVLHQDQSCLLNVRERTTWTKIQL